MGSKGSAQGPVLVPSFFNIFSTPTKQNLIAVSGSIEDENHMDSYHSEIASMCLVLGYQHNRSQLHNRTRCSLGRAATSSTKLFKMATKEHTERSLWKAKPLPFENVTITSEFWKSRIDVVQKSALPADPDPFAFLQLQHVPSQLSQRFVRPSS